MDGAVGVFAASGDVVTERHGRLFEQAADGIFTVDETGHFTSVNLIMERAMGHRRGDLLGKHCCSLLDASQQEIAKRILDGTLAGRRQRAEIAFRDVAGRDRIGSITCTPIIEQGRVTGALCIVRDVTQERRFAEELRQREKLAAVGQLVSGVAHELNNPLAGISAFAQLLEGAGPLNAEQRDAVDTIQMEAKRAAKIVSSLLLFSRQRQPERSSVDVNRVITDTLALRRFVLSTQQIELVTDLEPELPQTWADPFQLQQVVLNLLINAEHALAGRKGKRKVTRAHAALGRPHRRERVRQRAGHFRGDEPAAVRAVLHDEAGGRGLGARARDLARNRSATRRSAAATGHMEAGATFEIDLPIVSGEGAASHSGGSTDVAGVPRQRRFLIVDNEPAMRQALQLHLRRTGCFADAVGDANSALALLATRKYGSIFLDLHLGGLAGESLFADLVERDPDHAGRVDLRVGRSRESSGAPLPARRGTPVRRKAVRALDRRGDADPGCDALMATVLVIDDTPEVTAVLGAFFERAGDQVVRVHSGEEGIEAYQRTRPDLVLLDLQLPDMSGFDVLERIREDEPVVIMMTGHGDIPLAVQALQARRREFSHEAGRSRSPCVWQPSAGWRRRVCASSRATCASGAGSRAWARCSARRPRCASSRTRSSCSPRAIARPCSCSASRARRRGRWRTRCTQ